MGLVLFVAWNRRPPSRSSLSAVAKSLVPADPGISHLDVRSLDRGPGDAMGCLFLPPFDGMGGVGVIEGLAIDVLGVRGQMRADRNRQINIGPIGHGIASSSYG